MKKALIHVKGKVQRVGYRDEVEEIARQLEITGFVENIKPYDKLSQNQFTLYNSIIFYLN